MLCKSCGDELVDNELRCRSCGAENESFVEVEQKRILDELSDEGLQHTRENIRQFKQSTLVIRLFILFLTLCTIGFAVYFYVTLSNTNSTKVDATAVLQDLESFYVAGDYVAMNDLLDNLPDKHRSVFDKYTSVGYLYSLLDIYTEGSPSTKSIITKHPDRVDVLEDRLNSLFIFLNKCQEHRAAGFVFDEEEEILSFEEQVTGILADTFLLTEEEIQQGMLISREADPDYSEICNKSIERLVGGKE